MFDWHFPEVCPCGEQRTKTLLHGVECIFVGYEVKLLDFGEVGIGKFLEDVSGTDHELDRLAVVRAENVKHLLQTDAVSIDNGVILELVDKLVLLGGVLELVDGKLHVYLE